MKSFNIFSGAPVRAAAIGLLAAGLLIPATVSAAPDVTGTLVGLVSCAGGQNTRARIVVGVEGMDLSTHSAGGGEFRLAVPAGQTFTLSAFNPSDASVASRFNVVVQQGETLDVGALDLATCPQLLMDTASQEQPQEDARDLIDQG